MSYRYSCIAPPFVIRSAVIEGVATATEVSTIGIVYSVLAGLLIYRQFHWRRLYPMLIETAALSGAILLIIGAATGMAWALTQSGFLASLAAFMTGLPGGGPTFLPVTVVAFVILGSVLEGIPAIGLFGPLLFLIAKQVGVHEVHYSMVVILAMGIGLFALLFGGATMRPARSAASTRTRAWDRSSATCRPPDRHDHYCRHSLALDRVP